MNLVEAAEFHRRALERMNRSPATLRLYRVYVDAYLRFLAESDVEPTLDALNPQFVRECQGWYRARSHGRRGGLVTEKMLVATLKTWGRFLWENDVYPFDPLARLKKPKVPKIKRKPFTADEAKRLVQAAAQGPNAIRDRALLLLLFDTACRIGELLAATVDDVDVAEGSILFRQTKNGVPKKVIFRVSSRRDGGACLSAVRNWLKVRDAYDDVDALFTTRERRALSTRRARELFAELGKVAGVPNAHPHRCRHTGASEAIASGMQESALRSRLGQVSHDVLYDYVTIADRSAHQHADLASLSQKWGL